MWQLQNETLSTTAILLVALSCYLIGCVAYRLYFHPLSNIPGPKLAALTRWYECYFDVLCWPGGAYTHQVDRMHEKYGRKLHMLIHGSILLTMLKDLSCV